MIINNNVLLFYFQCFLYTSKTQEDRCNKKLNKKKVCYKQVNSSASQTSSSSSSSSKRTSSSSISSSSSSSNKKRSFKMTSSFNRKTQPTAPPSGLVLFNTEEQSDLVFLVGNSSEKMWRFPAHTFIVKEASPVFKWLVESQNNNKENSKIQCCITCCQPETFHIIMR